MLDAPIAAPVRAAPSPYAWFLGSVGSFAPGPVGEVLSYLSLSSHFPDFMRGIVDTKAIIYYLSVSALFLYLATGSIESGRWR